MKKDHFDLSLQGAILELGQAIQSAHVGLRPRPGSAEPERAAAAMYAAEDKLLVMVKADVTARRRIGIKLANQDDGERRVRLRAFSLMAHRALVQPSGHPMTDISDLAAASMDRKSPCGESVLRARHVVGKMAAEDVLIAFGGSEGGPCDKVVIPAVALDWLCGGKASMGFLTVAKMLGGVLPDEANEAQRTPPASRPIPTAKDLGALIRKDVIGLDEQAQALSSRLVMHLARAKMLAAGKDPGTGNQAILLFGNSGCGKSWLIAIASKAAGCPFASMSATAMTSEGYVGGKLDDLFKALVMKAKGEVSTARFGIAFADEWDKKALRHGRDVTTLAVQQEILVPMQGAEFSISGKRSMERAITFDSRGTFFAFAGAFSGLAELIRKKTNSSCIGFSEGSRTKRGEYIRDSIVSYGYIREWVNRLSAVMFLPDPSLKSLETASAKVVLESFNALLGELGVVLFPHEEATLRAAEYALESRTFYRGLKSVWWNIAESAVAGGEHGTVLVGNAEIEAAIARVSSGSADGEGENPPPRDAGAEADGSSDGAID